MVRFKSKHVLNTCGDGYWSSRSAPVEITRMDIAYLNEEQDFGELRVYFTADSWNINKDGLIYTDSQWLDELQALLTSLGYAGQDADYSEQGLQGHNYVSLDIGKVFINSWNQKHQLTV